MIGEKRVAAAFSPSPKDVRTLLALLLGRRRSSRAAAAAHGVPSAFMSSEECISGIVEALKHPTVIFLRDQMARVGCPFWSKLFTPLNCRNDRNAGYYAPKRGILICCDNMIFQDHIQQVLIHELIHAYDDCTANINWKNCGHHACSEIRANHLSGDCHYKRELLRGYMKKIGGHEQECVKRRALQSVRNNPNCSGEVAKNAIEAVWDICYNDTKPFDRAP